ncbi:MAG: clan AA aspartic protease [Deltaproteobacteria bacterium]|nr:clan AA aspartic protease [Deltaproteobacteria bacterium]
MGLIKVTVTLRPMTSSKKKYQSVFLVDTGATDSMAPARVLKKIGIKPVGKTTYELANGTTVEYPFGGAVIEFMGDTTFGRIIFGPDDAEPILGVTALESVGIMADPRTQALKRLPAVPLKSLSR